MQQEPDDRDKPSRDKPSRDWQLLTPLHQNLCTIQRRWLQNRNKVTKEYQMQSNPVTSVTSKEAFAWESRGAASPRRGRPCPVRLTKRSAFRVSPTPAMGGPVAAAGPHTDRSSPSYRPPERPHAGQAVAVWAQAELITGVDLVAHTVSHMVSM
jgi:hypothetical protein